MLEGEVLIVSKFDISKGNVCAMAECDFVGHLLFLCIIFWTHLLFVFLPLSFADACLIPSLSHVIILFLS